MKLTGGASWTYSGFNASAFDDLYWGVNKTDYPFGAGLNGTLLPFSFSNLAGNVATWSLTSDYLDAYPPGTGSLMSIPIEFRMTLVSGGSLILASSVPGLDPTLGAVVDTLGGGNFQVKLEFVALGLPETGLNEIDKLQSAGLTRSSFGGGFYWTDPVSTNVPDGGSSAWIIIPTALAFIGARRVFSAA